MNGGKKEVELPLIIGEAEKAEKTGF